MTLHLKCQETSKSTLVRRIRCQAGV